MTEASIPGICVQTHFRKPPPPDYFTEYLTVLYALHRLEKPRNYLEIGVYKGGSLQVAHPRTFCVGVDPSPQIAADTEECCHIERTTSDDFFAGSRVKELFGSDAIDMAFIDGMHLFEYALRDFMNMERHSDKHTLLVVHDVIPRDAISGSREPPPPGADPMWMGDVWKLLLVLDDHRPDLEISLLKASPSGLALIRRLDASSNVLPRQYEALLSEYGHLTFADWEDRQRELVPRLLGFPESLRWRSRVNRVIRRSSLNPWLTRARHPIRSVRHLGGRVLKAMSS
jgi:hypothetical protein